MLVPGRAYDEGAESESSRRRCVRAAYHCAPDTVGGEVPNVEAAACDKVGDAAGDDMLCPPVVALAIETLLLLLPLASSEGGRPALSPSSTQT